MRTVTFTRKITIPEPGGTFEKCEIEVEVSAQVQWGPGGPDPTIVDNLTVTFDGNDITDKLDPSILEALEDEAVDVLCDGYCEWE